MNRLDQFMTHLRCDLDALALEMRVPREYFFVGLLVVFREKHA